MVQYTSARVYEKAKNSGVWKAALSYKDDFGKWRQKTKTIHATSKREAERQLVVWRAEMEARGDDAQQTVIDGPKDVEAMIVGYLDRTEASGRISPTTVKDYRVTANRIIRDLGALKLSELSPTSLEDWEASLLADGYKAATVVKSHRLLKMVLDNAVRNGWLLSNPMTGIKPPRMGSRANNINALDAEGRARVVELLQPMVPSTLSVAALIALYTGLRRGEICGLKWRDIDFKRRVMWVNRSIGVADETYIKDTKTHERRVAHQWR